MKFETKMAQGLNDSLSKLSLEQRIIFLNERFSRPVFLSEFLVADQYLTWLLAYQKQSAKIIAKHKKRSVLDDNLMQLTAERYGIEILLPEDTLADTLAPFDALVTSNYLDQDEDQNKSGEVCFAKWDDKLEVVQLNPLADYSFERLWQLSLDHEIPVNLTEAEIRRVLSETQNAAIFDLFKQAEFKDSAIRIEH